MHIMLILIGTTREIRYSSYSVCWHVSEHQLIDCFRLIYMTYSQRRDFQHTGTLSLITSQSISLIFVLTIYQRSRLFTPVLYCNAA